jgi:hypothetical protein
MLWQYTRRDTKILLFAVLCMFSAYGLLVGQSWSERVRAVPLTANSVGMLAAVPANEINTRNAELNQREYALLMREEMLKQHETGQDDTTLLLVTMVGAGLLGLILLNFYLDSRRRVALVS